MNARFSGFAFPILLGRFAQKTTVCARIALWILEAFIADFPAELLRAAGRSGACLASALSLAPGIRAGPLQTMGADSMVLIDEFLRKFVNSRRTAKFGPEGVGASDTAAVGLSLNRSFQCKARSSAVEPILLKNSASIFAITFAG